MRYGPLRFLGSILAPYQLAGCAPGPIGRANISIQRLAGRILFGGMFVTRKAEFSASHVCRVPGLSDAENRDLFGEEANPNGHGHNYILEVTIEGDPDPINGMVIDLRRIKDVLEDEVIGPMDHRFLNYEVPPFDRVVPTPANLAKEIWRRLEGRLSSSDFYLASVRLFETPDSYVEVLSRNAHPRPALGEELTA